MDESTLYNGDTHWHCHKYIFLEVNWFKICEMTIVHIISMKVFQQYQNCNKGPHGLG
jgi:hypothetical protein